MGNSIVLVLLSGAVGALVATLLSIVFQHLKVVAERRVLIAQEVSKYYADVISNFGRRLLHRDMCFKTKKDPFDDLEFGKLTLNATEMLAAIQLYTILYITYGRKDRRCEIFSETNKVFSEANDILLNQEDNEWNKGSLKVNKIMSNGSYQRLSLLHNLQESTRISCIVSDLFTPIFHKILVVAGFFSLIFFPIAVWSAPTIIYGPVTEVVDGDTFYIIQNNKRHKIHLYGTDAPELNQFYGMIARKELQTFIDGNTVQCEVKNIGHDKQYVADCYITLDKIPDIPLSLSGFMISNGNAWVDKKTNKGIEYPLLELRAKENRYGLWATDNPTPPWEWRKLTRGRKLDERGRID